MRWSKLVTVGLTCAALFGAGCGGDDDGDSSSSGGASTTQTEAKELETRHTLTTSCEEPAKNAEA